jgi:hypothetical protein
MYCPQGIAMLLTNWSSIRFPFAEALDCEVRSLCARLVDWITGARPPSAFLMNAPEPCFSSTTPSCSSSLYARVCRTCKRLLDSEPDAVRLAVEPGAAVDYAVDSASRDQYWPSLSRTPTGGRSCCHHLRASDLNPVSGHLELHQIPALARSLCASHYTDRGK